MLSSPLSEEAGVQKTAEPSVPSVPVVAEALGEALCWAWVAWGAASSKAGSWRSQAMAWTAAEEAVRVDLSQNWGLKEKAVMKLPFHLPESFAGVSSHLSAFCLSLAYECDSVIDLWANLVVHPIPCRSSNWRHMSLEVFAVQIGEHMFCPWPLAMAGGIQSSGKLNVSSTACILSISKGHCPPWRSQWGSKMSDPSNGVDEALGKCVEVASGKAEAPLDDAGTTISERRPSFCVVLVAESPKPWWWPEQRNTKKEKINEILK